MLSPFNAHRNAGRIHDGGADRKQLTNALSTEIAPEGQHRAEQLLANQKLIERAGGLLAPINDEERYLTLGCGHTAAWCKLADVGGPTPEKVLRDDAGRIDIGKIKKDAEFKHMIEIGWDWEVVPWEVDCAYPKFAQIAQKALNVSNHVSSEVGELETAVTLAEVASDPGMQEMPKWKELALENVRSLNMPCTAYANIILDFVLKYGGGLPAAPQVRFMDAFAKQFQCSVNLGEQFWSAMTYSEFSYSKLSKFPFLRVAMAMANLTSEKQEEKRRKHCEAADKGRLWQVDKQAGGC